MSLALLRRRIRAGWYQDDLHSQEANHLLFLRWLVRAGLMSEWNEEEEEQKGDEDTVLARYLSAIWSEATANITRTDQPA